MKPFNFALIAIGAAVACAVPAAAQIGGGGYKGVEFVEAVRKSDGDKAMELLTSSAPGIVDSKADDGNTALIVALMRRDEEWTGFLLNKGADPNLAGSKGDTPLLVASRVGFDQAVEWLLSMGAKVDTPNRSGETPLIMAVQGRQTATAKLLLDAGADPDRTDTVAGYSARDYAQRDPRARDIQQLIQAKKPKPAGK